ncbi:MAG: hypothetical protein ACRDOA_11415 [Streptosporangiaceae bacterium]
MAKFTKAQRVRVIADGSTGTVDDPGYVHGGVLVMPDEPARPWAPLTPYLPSELVALDNSDCGHPEDERQKLHHNGIPIELCRACDSTRGFKADSSAWRDHGDLSPFPGSWGEWMPGISGWAAAPLFALPAPASHAASPFSEP